MMTKAMILISGVLAVASPFVAVAQEASPSAVSPAFARAMEPMVERDVASDRVVTTRHSTTIKGRKLAYRAIVSEWPMAEADGQPAAVAVTYAYVADVSQGAAKRPVTFVFNGGPGASSLPLHLNGIGPRRVAGTGAAARMADNADSPLDVTDLVFIDPVGTGVSMPIKGRDASGFWSVKGDARSVIDIIARWSAANGRGDAPKILMGESYGTLRAAAILGEDVKDRRVAARGVILTSPALGGGDGLVTGPMTLLPTLAAVAWYHNRIDRGGRSVEQHYAAALAFAQTDYSAALIRGDTLPAVERRRIATRMSSLIGIPADMLERSGLVIGKPTFMATVLGGEQRTGQLDARATRAIADSNLRPPFDDPSMSLGGEKSDRITPYLRDELGYTLPSPYRSLNLGINFKWDYGPGGFARLDGLGYFAAALKADPKLRVMSMGGVYDITTPSYSGVFTLDHSGIPTAQRTTRVYASGHSILEDDAVIATASEDIRRFVVDAVRD